MGVAPQILAAIAQRKSVRLSAGGPGYHNPLVARDGGAGSSPVCRAGPGGSLMVEHRHSRKVVGSNPTRGEKSLRWLNG